MESLSGSKNLSFLVQTVLVPLLNFKDHLVKRPVDTLIVGISFLIFYHNQAPYQVDLIGILLPLKILCLQLAGKIWSAGFAFDKILSI